MPVTHGVDSSSEAIVAVEWGEFVTTKKGQRAALVFLESQNKKNLKF